MEFKSKQFDGPYEISGIDIYNEGELFKGVLYCPPELYKKPYPLILYFHGFPQLFTLQEIARSYEYLLERGYALIIFNFRGYQFSDGQISITSQVSDGKKLVEFVELMIKNNFFDISNINIISHDFGAYIALILCSKVYIINKLLLVSPILDLRRHVDDQGFLKTLNYINCFLPGNIKGIENVEEFIKKTKYELSNEEFQIENAVKNLKCKKIKVIGGEKDKITPVTEIDKLFKISNIIPQLIVIQNMDHECVENDEEEKKNNEIKQFFEK